MKRVIFILLISVISTTIFGQTYQLIDNDADDRDTTELETLPWFGNNQYLNNFLDSIGYPSAASRIIGSDRVRYHVPIKFWVYRRTNGTGGPNMQNLQNYIDNLNRIYNVDNNTFIGFYMKCDVGILNSDQWFEIGGDGEAWNLIQNRKEQGCINIHIVGDYEQTAGIHIRSRFFGRDGIVLNFGVTGTNANTTIAHEVGHYFELDHTHQYSNRGKCRKEPVDRNRTFPFFGFCPFGGGGPSSQRICEATGDLLSDTPADPDLSNNRGAVGACGFNELGDYTNARDPWNDSYVSPPAGAQQPQTRNVMSYNRDRDCRTVFSRLQIAVLLFSIERGKSKNNKTAWKDLKSEYDEYEMDNFSEVARNILLNDRQERNFHQQYIEVAPIWSQCDIDWVRFIAPCSANLDILTSAMAGRTNANTRLTLYNSTLVQVAQNDNISVTNLFSRINWAFVAGQEYFIRVENMSPNVTGYYTLEIGNPFVNTLSITGNNSVCPSGSYAVAGLPAGATVSWTASPLNLVTFSCSTCSPTTINRIADGNVTITATVSVTVCGTIFTRQVSRQILAGSPPLSISSTTNGCVGAYQQWNIVNNTSSYGSNWRWSVSLLSTPTSQITINTPSSPSTTLSVKGGGTITLNYTDLCGVARTSGITVYSTCFGFSAVVSPNPVQNNINISLNTTANSVSTAEATQAPPIRVLESKGKTIMTLFEVNTNTLAKQWTHPESINKNYNLNANGLRKGVYVLQIDRDNQTTVNKIIIQ
jgi:Secretion system C-terminal sorting domain